MGNIKYGVFCHEGSECRWEAWYSMEGCMRLETSWLGKNSCQAWDAMGWDERALSEADA